MVAANETGHGWATQAVGLWGRSLYDLTGHAWLHIKRKGDGPIVQLVSRHCNAH